MHHWVQHCTHALLQGRPASAKCASSLLQLMVCLEPHPPPAMCAHGRYEAFKAIKEGPQWGKLTEAQQRIVDGELRDFVLGGVALEVGRGGHPRRWAVMRVMPNLGSGSRLGPVWARQAATGSRLLFSNVAALRPSGPCHPPCHLACQGSSATLCSAGQGQGAVQ